MIIIIQIILIIFGPYCCIKLVKFLGIEDWLSPVVLSYLLGIIMANIDVVHLNDEVSKNFSEIPILFAIPMLLYATDIAAWLKHARQTILSFLLCILSGVVASFLMAYFFQAILVDTWMLSGMLVGIYTGGTPNMQAIGLALGAGKETYVLLNAADIFCGGIYLVFLTSVAHRFLGMFLPNFIQQKETAATIEKQGDFTIIDILKVFGLTILIIATSLALTYLIMRRIDVALLILCLTSFSILASFSKPIRNLKGAYESGEYLLLMFCVAIGMMANFDDMIGKGGEIILFTACILTTTVVLHWFLSYLFKIDRDTTLITSTAALYGPAFIGQIAAAIKNRELIFSGMATGLIGYAIGNYLGISVAYLLKYLFY